MLDFLSRHIFAASRAVVIARPEAETMEPRLLYSADLMPAGLDGELATLAPEVRTLDDEAAAWLVPAAEVTRPGAIVFIDAAVEDADTLLADLHRDTLSLEIIRLEADRDGVDQISKALAGRDGLDAIHIVSHGAAGQLKLGNSRLDAAALEANAHTIAAWGSALTDTADILLYGCDVAGDANGDAFVAALARLTGADVAASENLTGAQVAGGDWTLEHHAGRVEANTLAAPAWAGTLAVTSTSGDIDVNTTEFKNQYAPAVAVFDDGGWVAVWQDDERDNVYARIFNADGSERVAEFRINADASGEASLPDVATDGAGRYVVAFTNTASGNQDVYVRVFDLDGVAQSGGDMLVNAGQTSGDQNRASVAMNAAGAFVVAWDGNGSGDSSGIYARRFDAADAPLGAVFRVNESTSGIQEKADVAMGGDGRFVVVWRDDQSGTRIDARLYDNGGSAGSAFTVTTGAIAVRDNPAVAMDAAGAFVVAWEFDPSLGPTTNYLQRFNADGSQNGSVELVNFELSYDQFDPDIAMNRAGDFVVSWTTLNKDGGGDGVYLRAYPGGSAAGSATVVNAYTSGDQHASAIAMNAAGHVVTVWDGQRNAGSMSDINGRTFFWPEASSANTAPVLNTSASPALDSFDEDQPGNGTRVSALVSLGGNVTDPDAGALVGIALLSVDDSNGVWHFRTSNGAAWIAIDAATLSSGNALLLSAESQTRLRFTPNANYNGNLNPAISFRAWDRTTGGNGTYANTDVNGGVTAFSAATDTATLTINAVNDLPDIARNQLTLAEGQTVTLGTAHLDASDVESSAANLTYTVNSVSAGFFALASSPTVTIGAFTQQQIIDGDVVFVHDGGEAAPSYTLTLRDGDGGSSAASAANIAFTWVNDAPVLADASPTITGLEGVATPSGAVGVYVRTLASLAGSGAGPQNIIDPDSGAIAGIAITAADETRGHWHYSIDDGANWAQLDIGSLPAGDARLLAADGMTRIYFHETTGGGAATIANGLTFHAWDGTTGVNGGGANPTPGGGSSAFSTAIDTVELVITSSNTRPVLGGTVFTVNATEDSPAPIGAVGFAILQLVSLTSAGSGPMNVTDTASSATGIAAVGATATNGAWWYSTDSGANWTQIVGASGANALLLANDGFTRLYYQSTTANYAGNDDGVLTFKAWDQTTGANGSYVNSGAGNAISNESTTLTVSILPVNDTPVVEANSLTISEGSTVTLGTANFDSSDVEEGDRSKLVFTIGGVSSGAFFNTATTSVVTTFTQADVDTGRIEFRHDGNESAPAYSFTLSDGTATTAAQIGVITFTNVNDAPVLTPSGSATYSLDEDAGVPAGAVGAPVSALVSLASSGSGPQNVTDPDAAGLAGIAIVGADNTNGAWYWSLDNGAGWNPLGAVSTTNARLLTAEAGMRIAFAPNAGYNGTMPALTFKAWDRSSWANGTQQDTTVGNAFSSATDTVTLSVRPVNDAPTVVAIDLGSIAEDGSRLITQAQLLVGASDADGDALSVSNVVLTAGSGAVVDNGDSTWTFTPTANWNGNAAFSFDVDDGTVSVANTASLVVTAGNDAPTVVAVDLGSMAEDGSRLITQAQLLAGANDVDGDPLSVSNVVLTAGNGTVVDNGDSTWTFTPTANWNGNAALSFDVDDGTVSVSNTASLVVNAGNDAPTVVAINLGSMAEDGSRLITQVQLLTGANDIDGDTLSVSNVVLTAGNGAIVDNGNSTWTFTPTANWNGNAALSFDVDDGTVSVSNTASLVVTAANDAPTVVAVDLGSMAEDGSRLITQAHLLAGANDIDGDTLSVSNFAITAGTGAIANNGNGTLTYTPGADWSGNTAFSFVVGDGTTTVTNTASLVVTAVNDAPTVSAAAQQTILAGEGAGPLSVTIGDVDSPLGTLTVSARSSNAAVLPDSAILLSGTGTQRSLSISASHAGGVGTAQIIIEVSDGSTVASARITIDAVASIDPPSITPITRAPTDAVVVEAEADAQEVTAADASPAVRTSAPVSDSAENLLGTAEEITLSVAPPPSDEVLRITTNSASDTSDSRALQVRLSDTDILSLTYRTELREAQLSSGGRIGDAIREAYIARTFDTLRDSASDETDAAHQRIGITMVTGAGLTVGYVAWLIRGGVLLTSLLTTMPAWRFLDPLPVLGGVKGADEGDDDSLEALVASDSADEGFEAATDSNETSIISGARA